jgi:hypothetical protein
MLGFLTGPNGEGRRHETHIGHRLSQSDRVRDGMTRCCFLHIQKPGIHKRYATSRVREMRTRSCRQKLRVHTRWQ